MKISVLVLLGFVDMTQMAQSSTDAQAVAITVYVRPSLSDPMQVLRGAEVIAFHMFRTAGVFVQWERADPKGHLESPLIVIYICNSKADTENPGALAYALAYEGVHIKIYWDRLSKYEIAGSRNLLAHVVVHEITHLLEGTNHHSPEGIMKARWTNRDFENMSSRPLTFDRTDIELIHDGWARRRSSRAQGILMVRRSFPARSIP